MKHHGGVLKHHGGNLNYHRGNSHTSSIPHPTQPQPTGPGQLAGVTTADPTLVATSADAAGQGNEKLKLVVEECDFDNKNPQGKIKQNLRQKCTSQWCLEVDADEIFDESKIEKIKMLCDDLPHRVYAVDLKAYNFLAKLLPSS